jgi:formylglycine-generating enzyme required for sulfatase activity
MKKQNKLGFLALIGLAAVARCVSNTNFEIKSRCHRAARLLGLMVAMSFLLLFTVCKASGAGTGTDERAVWKVTFDAAGGEPVPNPVTVADGETIGELPGDDLVKEGSDFGGWYPAESETEFTASTPVSGAITLYAKWTVVTYSVSYNANGGTGSMASSTHTYGESKRLSALSTGTISNEGHTFSGWALSEDNPSWDYADNDPVINLAASQDAVVPLYAVWAASTPAPSPIPDNMVSVAGGTFTMGSPGDEVSRGSIEVQHQVTVSAFYMGKHEVTQKEYLDTMGSWPETAPSGTYGLGDSYPAYNVSWLDAVKYCNKRSEDENLTPAYTVSGETVTWNKSANGYRLPTEAEWEYACRAGTTSPFNTGDNITTAQANYNGNYPYNGNPAGEYRATTTVVGTFAANAYGLYDMHGNVFEWCWDWSGDYESGPLTDPDGAVSGAKRVIRGGSWNYDAGILRSAFRLFLTPSLWDNIFGFRLVRPLTN